MGRISRQHLFQYSVEQLKDVAEKTRVSYTTVHNLVNGKGKTTRKELANEVSILTGKPRELYLVQKGVKIEAPVRTVAPSQDAYRMSRVAEETRLCDISDLDIVQLMREVAVLQAEIGIEMQRRMDNGKEK